MKVFIYLKKTFKCQNAILLFFIDSSIWALWTHIAQLENANYRIIPQLQNDQKVTWSISQMYLLNRVWIPDFQFDHRHFHPTQHNTNKQ